MTFVEASAEMTRDEQLELFDVSMLGDSRVYEYFPENWIQRMTQAARSRLFSMRRISTGTERDENEVDFSPDTNTWVAWKGAIAWSQSAGDIALFGATDYVRKNLTGNLYLTDEQSRRASEASTIVVEEYERIYPSQKVMVEPGY